MARSTYLVDAYNLIRAVDRLDAVFVDRGRHAAVKALVALCTRWLSVLPEPPEVVLVFDGTRPRDLPARPPSPTLRLRFMDAGADADLADLLRRGGPRTLVSADGELVALARREGHEVLAPREMHREVLADIALWSELHEKTRPPRASEAAAWRDAFARRAPPSGPAEAAVPPGTPPPLSPDEVQAWLAWFGEEAPRKDGGGGAG